MKKIVIDICPFIGLKWRYEDDEEEHSKGEGLTMAENNRLDNYFAKFYGQSFKRDKSIELAQMALDNVPVPENFNPQGVTE